MNMYDYVGLGMTMYDYEWLNMTKYACLLRSYGLSGVEKTDSDNDTVEYSLVLSVFSLCFRPRARGDSCGETTKWTITGTTGFKNKDMC